MKLTFISNYLNHHQLYICNKFYDLLKDNFKFIQLENVPQDKINLGYNRNFNVPYLLDNTNDIYKILDETDVLIIGSAPYKYTKYFMNKKRLLYVYSERLFKDGTWHKYSPLARYNMNKLYNKPFHNKMYLLCSSAYTASDFNDFNSFKNSYIKWGYFPRLSYNSFNDIQNKKQKNSIIWVGRLIDWKHPEQVIFLSKFLKENNIDFNVKIIGDGPLKTKMEEYINKYNLSNNVTLLGSMHFDKVRETLENSEIFIFTSDFNEGWGAVLNEAMSSACACIASYKCGSTPYLLKDIGLIYNSKQDDLNNKVLKYLKDRNLLKENSKKSFDIINTLWNYDIAAKRLIEFSKQIMENKKPILYDEGPFSKAEIITNKSAKSFINYKI